MGARSWAGVVFSLFPVQTLGELGLGRGEVISRSNCKVGVGGGGCCSFPVGTQSHASYGCSMTDHSLHFDI